MKRKRYAVLLVDDSDDDRFFMKLAMERSRSLYVAAEVRDGQEAIEYLQGDGPFHDRATFPWPDLILLDLSMPRMNGFDVLRWIKRESLTELTVVVVSGSFLERDVSESLRMGARSYFQKSPLRTEQKRIVGLLEQLKEKERHSPSLNQVCSKSRSK
ncbi:MAG: response regulator [Candidatus Methylacidiphilales bacterium]|nr:response regulator [Candidatus Methylacidiphilales bacterium]